MSASVTVEQFKSAMARFPGAVTIITSLADGGRRGVTATAVCSVSADPPSLLACVNRRTGTCRAVHDCDRFNVNLLPDPSAALALRFAGAGDATGEEKFALGNWAADRWGVPHLTDALIVFHCQVIQSVDSGSHTVFIGKSWSFVSEMVRRSSMSDPVIVALSQSRNVRALSKLKPRLERPFRPAHARASSSIMAAPFSAIMTVGLLVLPEVPTGWKIVVPMSPAPLTSPCSVSSDRLHG